MQFDLVEERLRGRRYKAEAVTQGTYLMGKTMTNTCLVLKRKARVGEQQQKHGSPSAHS